MWPAQLGQPKCNFRHATIGPRKRTIDPVTDVSGKVNAKTCLFQKMLTGLHTCNITDHKNLRHPSSASLSALHHRSTAIGLRSCICNRSRLQRRQSAYKDRRSIPSDRTIQATLGVQETFPLQAASEKTLPGGVREGEQYIAWTTAAFFVMPSYVAQGPEVSRLRSEACYGRILEMEGL